MFQVVVGPSLLVGEGAVDESDLLDIGMPTGVGLDAVELLREEVVLP